MSDWYSSPTTYTINRIQRRKILVECAYLLLKLLHICSRFVERLQIRCCTLKSMAQLRCAGRSRIQSIGELIRCSSRIGYFRYRRNFIAESAQTIPKIADEVFIDLGILQ